MLRLHSVVMLHWCLIQTCLFNSIAVGDEKPKKKLMLVEKTKVKVPFEIKSLTALRIQKVDQLLVMGEQSACWLNMADYSQCQHVDLGKGNYDGTMVQMAPDGAFSYPAMTMTDEDDIKVVDITIVAKPIVKDLVSERSECNPTWISDKEFLLTSDSGMKLATGSADGDNEWSTKNIKEGMFKKSLIVKNVWKSFHAVFAAEPDGLMLMWAEDDHGNPGNFKLDYHLQINGLPIEFNIANMQLVDGEVVGEKVLVLMSDAMSVIALRIPQSDDFRNLSTYQQFEIKLPGSDPCGSRREAFIPYKSYRGKPWISDIYSSFCAGVNYFEPLEHTFEFGSAKIWKYDKKQTEGLSKIASSAWSINIRSDGFAELFASSESEITIYYFTDAVKQKTTVASAATQVSSKLFLKCLVLILSYLAA